MDRIRQRDSKYQVLITPIRPFDTSNELLIGDFLSFTGSPLANEYKILSFDTLHEAQHAVKSFPEINWRNLLIQQSNAYADIRIALKSSLNNLHINYDLVSMMLNEKSLKDNFMDKVLSYQNFNLAYDVSIIKFIIKCSPCSHPDVIAQLYKNASIKIKRGTNIANDKIMLNCISDNDFMYKIIIE